MNSWNSAIACTELIKNRSFSTPQFADSLIFQRIGKSHYHPNCDSVAWDRTPCRIWCSHSLKRKLYSCRAWWAQGNDCWCLLSEFPWLFFTPNLILNRDIWSFEQHQHNTHFFGLNTIWILFIYSKCVMLSQYFHHPGDTLIYNFKYVHMIECSLLYLSYGVNATKRPLFFWQHRLWTISRSSPYVVN